MANHQVRALLMGGQACVFYGAAEFSRDTDLLILATVEGGIGAAAPFGSIQISDRQRRPAAMIGGA